MTRYDIIGDVHGCARELKDLLGRLGYERDGAGVYRHPDRTAVFIGDLVDRGPGQLEVLEIVKAMHDAGSALMVMGNHEFNAICFAIPDPDNPGGFLRKHSPGNVKGHAEFTGQLSAEQQRHYRDWFRTLPLWLDLGGIRLIHACWHPDSMKVVDEFCGSNVLTTDEHYVEASRKGSPLYEAVETLLKGPEISLTALGCEPYRDHGEIVRTRARVRWWDQDARTLRQIADVRGMKTDEGLEYGPLPEIPVDDFDFSLIYTDPVPVIYGHYWFEWDNHLDDWTEHTACVDFSPIKEGGKLVAYRWNGEPTISPTNYWPHEAVAETPSD